MQRFFATTLAVVLLGATANAQVLSSPTPRARTPVGPSTPGSITSPTSPTMMPPSPMPGAGATGLSAFGLGSIFPTLGSLGPIPGTSLGAITLCPSNSVAGLAASATVNLSSPITSGLVPPSPPPVVPLPVLTPFGTGSVSGLCSPTVLGTETDLGTSSATSTLPDTTTDMTSTSISTTAVSTSGATLAGSTMAPPLAGSPAPGSTLIGTTSVMPDSAGDSIFGTVGGN